MLKTINSKRIVLLVLTALLYIFPSNAQYTTTHCVFLDLGKHPVYIDGVLSGTTNKLMEVDCGTRYVVIQRGKRFYGRYVNIDAYRRDIDISAAPRIYGYEPKKTSNSDSSVATNSTTTNNGYTAHKSQTRASNSISAKHLTIFCENGKYGYKDNNGTVAIKAKYHYAEPFIDELNCAIVKRGKKYGIINAENKFIVKPQYQELTYIHNDHFMIKLDDRYGVMDINNNIIIWPYCKEITADSKFYVCRRWSYWQIVDHNGNKLLETCYQIKYTGEAGFAVLEDKDSKKLWFHHFSQEEQKVYDFPDLYYDDIIKLSNNAFVVSKDGRYSFIGANGKQTIGELEFTYIDIPKLENGEWQYTTSQNKNIYAIRNNNNTNEIEILTINQFISKDGNLWAKPYYSQNIDKYSYYKQNFLVSKFLYLSPLNSPNFPKTNGELTENSGGDSYVHSKLRSIDIGGFSFIALKHRVDKQHYLYVINKSSKSTRKKLAFSEFATFADLAGGEIQINGIATLSNGDVLLTAEARVVTGYDTYMRDPVYINIQGQPVAIDNGGSYRYYNRDDVTVIFILDGRTFDLKHSRIMPDGYDNIYVSLYNGFYAYKIIEHCYGNVIRRGFEITPEQPLLKFTNSCRDDWSFAPSEGEGIECMYEKNQYIYMGGYTKNKGYVGFKNPYVCKLDLETGTTVQSISYKLKDRWIDSFEGDCAWTNERNVFGDKLNNKNSFSLLDSFEGGNIEFVDITIDNFTFTGLAYNNKYWLIPPVLPGQGKKTYGEWTIYPPTIIYNEDSKNIAIVHSMTTKNDESVEVEKRIDLNAK